MARFAFRYQTLLQHRCNVEDRCQRELATQLRSRMILADQLRSMQESITQSKRDLGEALVGRVDLSRVGEFTRYNAESTLRGRALVRKIAELEKGVDHARATLLEATRQRKALDLLRERDLRAWHEEESRRETAELDELASQAYTRRLLEEQQARADADDQPRERAA